MKLATFTADGTTRIGIVEGDGVIDVGLYVTHSAVDLMDVVANWGELRRSYESVRSRSADYPLHAIRLEAPVKRPGKIFAIGLNFADHVKEAGLPMPTEQIWFTKPASAIVGPYDAIELPTVSEQLDYESELVVMIGKRCRHVPYASAEEVIFGLCVGNDVSVRDWQTRTSQWVLGKSFDTHAPMGPWITTADEASPDALEITGWVNGELRQSSNTRNLVFSVSAQIECLTKAMTLEPGDLIFTGTPGGVGFGYKPPRWLKVGDVVKIEIEGLGFIANSVVAGGSNCVIS